VELGKLADLVILDGDPLEDIRNTTRIWRVMKRDGFWIQRRSFAGCLPCGDEPTPSWEFGLRSA